MFRSRSPYRDARTCFGLWSLRSVTGWPRRITSQKLLESSQPKSQQICQIKIQPDEISGRRRPHPYHRQREHYHQWYFFCVRQKRGRERHAKFSLALSNLRFRSERMEKSVAKDDGNVTHRAPSLTHSLLRDILNSIWKNYKIKLTWLCVLPFSRSGADSLSISLAAVAEKANKGARRKKNNGKCLLIRFRRRRRHLVYLWREKKVWIGEKYKLYEW